MSLGQLGLGVNSTTMDPPHPQKNGRLWPGRSPNVNNCDPPQQDGVGHLSFPILRFISSMLHMDTTNKQVRCALACAPCTLLTVYITPIFLRLMRS
eukprot:1157746-Pelagomonas_calceolata.AAC.11